MRIAPATDFPPVLRPPPLYCMYLDKPMRDHVLLQAISRVNRPFAEKSRGLEKSCGLVVDFVGIFGDLEKALAFDKREIVESVIDMEDIMTAFEKGMREDARPYLDLCGLDDRALEKAREKMTVRETREAFYSFFRRMQIFYELLSPDARLRPFVDDYRALSALYRVVAGEFDGRRLPPRLLDLAQKTRKLLMEEVKGMRPREPEPPAVLDEALLEKLKPGDEPGRLQIHGLLRAMIAAAESQAEENPALKRLGEQAENLRERFESRQEAAGVVLELLRLGREVAREKREMENSGLSGSAFAVFTALNARKIPNSRKLAEKVAALAAERFPHYRENPEQEQGLRIAIYESLGPPESGKSAKEVVDEIIGGMGK